jgi:hypothetical protein
VPMLDRTGVVAGPTRVVSASRLKPPSQVKQDRVGIGIAFRWNACQPDNKAERRMQTRWLRSVLAALAALILLPAVVQAQVNPFRGGPGLSQEDSRLLFESVARSPPLERLNAR